MSNIDTRDLEDRALALQTTAAMDYTPDELDDLVGRKIEDAPFSGDAMARRIRARNGAARANRVPRPYRYVLINLTAARNLWPAAQFGEDLTGNRRMAAVGGSAIEPGNERESWSDTRGHSFPDER
jgi:hypothetical protein